MSNSISFLGNIANEPELKEVGQNSVLEFTLANNVGFGDRQVTNWFRCTMWGKRAVSLQPHLAKGKQIFVIGQLSLRKFTDREGVERLSPDVRVNEIEFVRGGNGGGDSYASTPAAAGAATTPPASSPETEDDMPF